MNVGAHADPSSEVQECQAALNGVEICAVVPAGNQAVPAFELQTKVVRRT